MPHAHFVRGPSPVTVWMERASNMVAATGKHLAALPAAGETLTDTGKEQKESGEKGTES